MSNISFRKYLCPIVITLGLFTSCDNIEVPPNDFVPDISTITEVTTTIDENALIPFNDYEIFEENGEYFFTINQEGMEGCYYTISMFYGSTVIEYVSGDGFIKSGYGEFSDGDTLGGEVTTKKELDDSEEDDDGDNEVVTITEETISIENLVGKDGKWTFKCIGEGTDYFEIKLINEFGDVRYKSQYTCIVDTHLEAHMYYTNINY